MLLLVSFVVVCSVVEIAIAVVVFRSLNNGFCEDVGVNDGSGVITSTRLIDVSVMFIRSQRSPRYPAGHSQENDPSSLVNDVHLPPFLHVSGFNSQKLSCSSHRKPPQPFRQLHSLA